MRIIALVLLAALGCGESRSGRGERDPFAEIPEGEAASRSASLGPVEAEVRLRPAQPRVGDVVFLELEVRAPEGFDIELPRLDRALGRFAVIDTASRERRTEDESFAVSRLYSIQVLRSGPSRIPRLRVEVTDRRPGAEGAGDVKELLTEELPFTASSVDPGEADELRPGPGRLEVTGPPLWTRWWVWPLAAIPLLAVLAALALRLRRKARAAARASAYQRALERLRELEAAGLPEPDELDAWYVELSYLIRHYLEDRFRVRAPERTTEEFLREARRAPELSAQHQSLLAEFLAGCDRVKFARHQPSADEQRAALETAVHFVEQTRPERPEEASS